MPPLVTLVGANNANIFSLHAAKNAAPDTAQAINEMSEPSAMVYLDSAGLVTGSGGRIVIENAIRIALRLRTQTDYMDFWTEFCNGTPTANPRKLTDIEVAACLDPMRNWSIARQTLIVTQTSSIDFFMIGFAVRQAGC